MIIRYGPEHLNAEGLLPLLSAESMRAADRQAIEEYGISVQTLMEQAGRACAATATRMLKASGGEHVSVMCGKGNNGGDGFAAARVLALQGFDVDVFSITTPEGLSPDAAHQYRLLERLLISSRQPRLHLHVIEDADALEARATDLWIDALLGTGIMSQVRPSYGAAIETINTSRSPVLSIDIPSGLDADDGTVHGTAVRADVTVTMGALKSGMVRVPEYCGIIEVAEIGIPAEVLSDGAVACLTTDHAVTRWLPVRAHDAHKYSAGTVLVVGGSKGMTGAPVMSARSAARGGAGYVIVATPENVQPIVGGHLVPETTVALPQEHEDGLDPESSRTALEPILARADSVALGPGLGRATGTVRFIRSLLRDLTIPTVIDADALFALSTDPASYDILRRGNFVLTPHMGEFKRLLGTDASLDDPAGSARDFASRYQCTVVLKGAPTLVAGSDGTVLFAGAGNQALATAGTGDVLAGLCASFLARGLDPVRAAAAAMHVGGTAAEAYSERNDLTGMIATDIIDMIPSLIKQSFSAR